MKALMITIKPQYACLMMNGDKTIEVRKNKALANAIKKLIAEYGKARIYVAVSKCKPYLIKINDKQYSLSNHIEDYWSAGLNGKVTFMFECECVEDIKYHFGYYDLKEWTECYILEKSCLTAEQLDNYLKASYEYDEKKPSKVYGYAIHIDKLTIFDKLKELSEFDVVRNDKKYKKAFYFMSLTKAPQNFCYVEVEE